MNQRTQFQLKLAASWADFNLSSCELHHDKWYKVKHKSTIISL